MACEVWLRRDFLLRHGHTPDEPPCEHDDCPETAGHSIGGKPADGNPPLARHTLHATPADVTATEARRLGEGDHDA